VLPVVIARHGVSAAATLHNLADLRFETLQTARLLESALELSQRF